jgi:MscS family membrane protein
VLVILLFAVQFFAVVAAVWTGFRMIDLFSSFLLKKASKTSTKFDDLLIPLVSRTLKVFVGCIGVVSFAEAFNLPIAGLISGLGIGGVALAFAAKDTVANLFGSLTVLVDRPFEIGDWIVTDGAEGSVETVGMRSTRVRTFYNSLITIPNSNLTTAVVDNMGRRRYRRIKTMLGLEYDTPPDKIEAFCEGVRELIRRHPYTRKDYYHVYLNQFSASSLDVLLYCFIECPDWAIELREKQRLFLDILKLADALGVSFAFPTQTLHLHQEEAWRPATRPARGRTTHDGRVSLAAKWPGLRRHLRTVPAESPTSRLSWKTRARLKTQTRRTGCSSCKPVLQARHDSLAAC